MSETITLNNIGNQGLSSDPMNWTLPPEFITYGKNFRIYAGSIISSGGVSEFASAPSGWYPAFITHVGSLSSSYWIIAGRTKVYVLSGSTWTDITSTAGYSTLGTDGELLWNSCQIGSIPILNNIQHFPEYWSPQQITQIMQPLMFDAVNTWSAKGYSANVFRSHKNFLFALNLAEGGTSYKDSFRWSHPADINGLPATWDETDDAFLAGKASLGGNYGDIIDGKTLRDSFVIYSETGINVLDYTFDELVWRRRELSSSVGLLSKNCVTEVKGTHFLLSDGDVVSNDGTTIKSIAYNRIKKEITARIDTVNYNRCYTVKNDKSKEIWFCIPDLGADYPNLAYIYNWYDDSWSVRDLLEDTAFSNYGTETVDLPIWSTNVLNWNTDTSTWGASPVNPLDDTILGINITEEKVYYMDPDSPDGNINFTIERLAFPLIDDRQVTTITRVYPHIQGPGTVMIEFGSHDFPDSPVRWKPAMLFDPNSNRKIDIRTTGELHAWRFTSVDKSPITMSGMTIEFERGGLR